MVVTAQAEQVSTMRADDIHLRYGVPDVDLDCASGRRLNPANFVGHQLLVLFLPSDEAAAIREFDKYRGAAEEFSGSDSWIIGIVPQDAPSPGLLAACHAVAADPDQIAWNAFQRLLNPRDPHSRDEGGAYLFGRGGNLQRAWFGPSSASEVVEEIARPGDW